MPEMPRVRIVFACAPTPGLAEQARVISPHGSNALARVATERVVKKRVAKWREGDGVHWMLQVEKNLGERATNGAISKTMKDNFKAPGYFKHGRQHWLGTGAHTCIYAS